MRVAKTDYTYTASWLLFIALTVLVCAFIYDWRLSQTHEEQVSSYWAIRCQNETLPICHEMYQTNIGTALHD